LQDTITDRELMEWADFYHQEPFGELRNDIRAGLVCSLIANANRDTKRHPQPYEITDFLLYQERPPQKKQSAEEMRELLLAWTKR